MPTGRKRAPTSKSPRCGLVYLAGLPSHDSARGTDARRRQTAYKPRARSRLALPDRSRNHRGLNRSPRLPVCLPPNARSQASRRWSQRGRDTRDCGRRRGADPPSPTAWTWPCQPVVCPHGRMTGAVDTRILQARSERARLVRRWMR